MGVKNLMLIFYSPFTYSISIHNESKLRYKHIKVLKDIYCITV